MKSRIKRLFSLLCAISVLLTGLVVNAGSSEENGVNRFNVVLVLDKSGSLRDTDPEEYREDAIDQFIFLLADTGNYLGCVVFDRDYSVVRDLDIVNGPEEKASIVKDLKDNDDPTPGGTNIGGALKEAVDMLTDPNGGDPNLPSVIVLISDGKTEMPDNSLADSLEDKASAIETARDKGIKVYSVCLKPQPDYDTSEMQQIADATGGCFMEVESATDLQKVLSEFYALIYRTVPIPSGEIEVPGNGIARFETFKIPGLGVEEVNFVIYGKVDKNYDKPIKVLNSSGAEVSIPDSDKSIEESYAMVKWKNPEPGSCVLEVHVVEEPGEDKTKIYGNMIYNINLFLDGGCNLQQNTGVDSKPVDFTLYLGTGNELATSPGQYEGFSAELIISDADPRANMSEHVVMDLNKDGNLGFSVSKQLSPGTYVYSFRVTGYDLERVSELSDPFTIVHSDIPDPTVIPTPTPNSSPVPVQDEVFYKKIIIPFVNNPLTIPVTGLATDAEDSNLYYQLESTSFIDGKDYTFDGDKIIMTDCSLNKGDYIIKATDTGGLSCKIKITVTKVDIGLIGLITICSIAFLVIAGALLSLWYWKLRRLKGTLTVTDASNNEKTISGGIGQIRLYRLAGNCAGFDSKKSYIQCTGMGYVFFMSNKKFIGKSREPVKKVKIAGNGNPVTVRLPNSDACISFKFQANVRGRGGHGGGGRGVRGARGGRGTGRGPSDRTSRGTSRPVRSSPGRSSGGRSGLRR